MAFFDLSLEALENYLPDRHEPADFDAFWRATLDTAREHHLNAQFTRVDFGLTTVDVYDVTFSGYAGQPIKGWLLLPKHRTQPLPCVVEYIGYGGGRGNPTQWLTWSAAGYANLVMDTRGQGSAWSHGDTPDIAPDGDNPQYPGFMTRGIQSPQTYYYRRVFTDAVRAVEAAQAHEAVDANAIIVTGGSQGGGISIAVAGLMGEAVRTAMPDVPFLCHYRRATQITNATPYKEIGRYLQRHVQQVETVFNTLAYFDGVNFAARATAQALFSVGLMDEICPPSTVFAAYNHWMGEKAMRVYPYNEHEGGGSHHVQAQISFLANR